MTFLWVTTTPAGARVDPEVYCRYAVFGSGACGAGWRRRIEVQRVDLDDCGARCRARPERTA